MVPETFCGKPQSAVGFPFLESSERLESATARGKRLERMPTESFLPKTKSLCNSKLPEILITKERGMVVSTVRAKGLVSCLWGFLTIVSNGRALWNNASHSTGERRSFPLLLVHSRRNPGRHNRGTGQCRGSTSKIDRRAQRAGSSKANMVPPKKHAACPDTHPDFRNLFQVPLRASRRPQAPIQQKIFSGGVREL
jgi:hypothetical protein